MLWRCCVGFAPLLLLLPGPAGGSRHSADVSLDASFQLDADAEKKISDLMTELDEMVGLEQVKEDIKELRDQVMFDMKRQKMGIAKRDAQSLHMAFLGNPGTGKTAVARIVGELLVAMGAINPAPVDPNEPPAPPKGAGQQKKKPKKTIVKEVSRAELVGQYKGKTAVQVRKAVQSAFGGVLFIDEAYSLVKDDRDTFGREAVDTLIKEMEDNREYVVVILAGYREEMKEFFSSNPGFQSRVAFQFRFQDYTCDQLMQIAEMKVEHQRLALSIPGLDAQGSNSENDMDMEPAPLERQSPGPACGGRFEPTICKRLRTAITVRTGCCNGPAKECKENRANGNGRSVRNLLEASFRMMAQRVMTVYPVKMKGPKDSAGSIKYFVERRLERLERLTKELTWTVNAPHCYLLPKLEKLLAEIRGSPVSSNWAADREILMTNETAKAVLAKLDYRCVFSLLDDIDFFETFLGMLQDGLYAICRLSTKTSPHQISDLMYQLRESYDWEVSNEELLNLHRWLYNVDSCEPAMELLKTVQDRSANGDSASETSLYRVNSFNSANSAKSTFVQLDSLAMTENGKQFRTRPSGDGDGDKQKSSQNPFAGMAASMTRSRASKIPPGILEKLSGMQKQNKGKTFSGLDKAYADRKYQQIVERKNRLQRQEHKMKEKARQELEERVRRLEDLQARQDANKRAWAAKPKKKQAVEIKRDMGPVLGFRRLPKNAAPRKTAEADKSSADKLMEKLNGMIGLSTVKVQMQVLRYTVEFDQWRKQILKGAKTLLGQSYHMKFLGNPGTGKTEVARIVGELMLELEVFGKQRKKKAEFKFKEVSRAQLVASKVGQTAVLVKSAVEEAKGGVLFVDEAYSLVQSEKDTFGHEAVDTLIQEMENNRDKVIVILAGYHQEMDTFFKSNPGFESRVPFRFEFADYSCDELNQIAHHKLGAQKINAAEDADEWLQAVLSAKTGCGADTDKKDSDSGAETRRDKGNGRTVRNILESAQRFMASRVVTAAVKKTKFDTSNNLDDERLDMLYGSLNTSQLNALHADDIRAVAGDLVEDLLRATCKLEGETPTLQNPVRHVLQAVQPSEFKEMVDVSSRDCETGKETINGRILDEVFQFPDDDKILFTFPELEKLTGIQAVKKAMSELYSSVIFSKLRARADTDLKDSLQQSFHMRFVGNPGTGKTVTARVVAKLLVKLGVIQPPEPSVAPALEDVVAMQNNEEKDRFIEASRSMLVGEVVGETAQKTMRATASALGGVLFVDEAYSLVQGTEDSYGLEAVATLIKEMEDKRGELIVVLAGYEKEMDDFFESNPGFKSRVPFTFYFEDYTCDELFHIGSMMVAGRQLMMPKSRDAFEKVIRFNSKCCETREDCVESRDRDNGRGVRNIIESAKRKMSKRVLQAEKKDRVSPDVSEVEDVDKEVYQRLQDSDFQQVLDLVIEARLGVPCEADKGDLSIISQAIVGLSVDTMDELPETSMEREMKLELVHRVANDAALILKDPFTIGQAKTLGAQCDTELARLQTLMKKKLIELCNPGVQSKDTPKISISERRKSRVSRSSTTFAGKRTKISEEVQINEAAVNKGPLMQYVTESVDDAKKVVKLPKVLMGTQFLLDLLDATLPADDEEPEAFAHIRRACEWGMADTRGKTFQMPYNFLEKLRGRRASL